MSRLSALLILLLTACAAPSPLQSLRDPSVPVRSIAGFDLRRLAGTWTEAGYLATATAPACAPGQLLIAPAGAGFRLSGRLCGVGTPNQQAQPAGPGRLRLGAREWWVLWADHDNRTIVLADPAGSFALVLDRGWTSPDRRIAVAQLLAFNGFDPAGLRWQP